MWSWWPHVQAAPCALRGRPAPFSGRMLYKATKPGLVCVLYLSMFYILFCCLLWPLLCIVSFRWYVFCLLVVLVKLSLLAKWYTRKTFWGSLTVARDHLHKAQAEESLWLCWFIVFFHCFIAWYLCSPPAICDTFPTSMAWYSLFVLKVPWSPQGDVGNWACIKKLWFSGYCMPKIINIIASCFELQMKPRRQFFF